MAIPSFVLGLFVTSVLAIFWVFFASSLCHRRASCRKLVFLLDLCAAAALLVGLAILRWRFPDDCGASSFSLRRVPVDQVSFVWREECFRGGLEQVCVLFNRCFVFGIMNIIFFMFSAAFALFVSQWATR